MGLGLKDFTEPMSPSERAERERLRVAERLDNLAHNLAIAGGLCASFEMGRDAGPNAHVPFVTAWWRPGCGKPWTWPHITRDDALEPTDA